MAALLVVSLCVPEAFGDLGLTFAIAYGLVRARAARAVPRRQPRHRRPCATRCGSGWCRAPRSGSACSSRRRLWTAIASSRCGSAALALDMLGPYLFGSEGWKLVPHHFAERHGLILIIALGESIVAIGVGAEAGVDGGVIAAAVLGIALAAAMWWAYFDVVALGGRATAERGTGGQGAERDGPRLLLAPPLPDGGGDRPHRPGAEDDAGPRRRTAAARRRRSRWSAAWRSTSSPTWRSGTATSTRLNRQRLAARGWRCSALVPVADRPEALVTLAVVTALMVALIAYEAVRFADGRDRDPARRQPGRRPSMP